MHFRECSLNLAELSELGVKRVSIGSGLARVAFGAFCERPPNSATTGTFNLAAGAERAGDRIVLRLVFPPAAGFWTV